VVVRPARSASDGGGWGGVLGARPVGFIEITGDEARFRRIITTTDVLQIAGIAAIFSRVFARARRQRRKAHDPSK
jgi:hypothetical protein